MEAITWNELTRICKISLETNTDLETDTLTITIRNKKMNHLYKHRVNCRYLRETELIARLTNVKSWYIGEVICKYIMESKLESYFGEIKL